MENSRSAMYGLLRVRRYDRRSGHGTLYTGLLLLATLR